MRAIQIAVVASVCLTAGSSLAVPRSAPVSSPSAGWSAAHRRELVVRADVALSNTCWSNPALVRTPAGPSPVPTVRFAAQADYSGGRGVACGMIFRKVTVCTEVVAPPTARVVSITGSNGAVTAGISRTAPDCPARRER